MILKSSADWVLANARERLGDPYVYGGVYSPSILRQGADCSGVVGWVLEALTKAPANMSWAHNVSTESWYFDYNTNSPASPGTVGPYGTIAVASLSDIPEDAALTIDIMHGGGGEDSHTNCSLGGTLIESNGDYGSCTNGSGAYPTNASLWTDHWYLPGPVVDDDSISTILYPDLSNNNWSSSDDLANFLTGFHGAGFHGIVHKVSQGAGYQDPYWQQVRSFCEANDTSWLGYHYVSQEDANAQAQNFVSNNGGGNVMIDFENGSGDVGNFWTVVNAFNNAGVNVSMAYIPHWYWNQIGSPLLSLTGNQISLVSSAYPCGPGDAQDIYNAAGGAGGEGWVPYGSTVPTVWQYTNQASIEGRLVDCNAYIGVSLDALFTGNVF